MPRRLGDGGHHYKPFTIIETAEFSEGIRTSGPRLLLLAFQCEKYRSLPYSGGVLEQPAGLLDKMDTLKGIYRAYMIQAREGNKPGEMAKWRKENEATWMIISDVERLKKWHKTRG